MLGKWVWPDIKTIILFFNVKHDYFRNSFFPSTVNEWNKLDSKKCKLVSMRPSVNSTFHNCKGLKLKTRLRQGLIQLRFYKFKHRFQYTLNPICNCGTVEITIL